MRTATGLTLIALGAILGLAVNASTPGINLHVVGLIIALTGGAGLLLRSRATGWLRRRVVLDSEAGEDAPHEHGDRQAPAYLVEDPAVLAAEVLSSAQLAEMGRHDGHQASGHQASGHQDSGHQDSGPEDSGPEDSGHQASNREDSGHQASEDSEEAAPGG
jgi:hypothetical protein